MHLSELKALHVSQLLEMANANEIEGANRLRKQELVFALLKNRAKKGEPIFEPLPPGGEQHTRWHSSCTAKHQEDSYERSVDTWIGAGINRYGESR
jgi:transcription termination factor Rho